MQLSTDMQLVTEFFKYNLIAMALQAMRAIGIAALGLLCVSFIRVYLKKKILALYPDPLRVNVIIRLLTYAMLFIIATIVLHEFGINVTALVGAAGVVGVAVGFASQTSMSNIVSGLFLMIYRPFDLNDQIMINNIVGKIQEVSLFAITLRTIDNKIVRIPNEQVIKSNIINMSKEPHRGFKTTIDLAPETDIHKAMQLIEELVQASDYLVKEPKPIVVIEEVTGTYSRILVAVYTKQKQWLQTRKNFLADVKKVFTQHDIKLADVLLQKQQ